MCARMAILGGTMTTYVIVIHNLVRMDSGLLSETELPNPAPNEL